MSWSESSPPVKVPDKERQRPAGAVNRTPRPAKSNPTGKQTWLVPETGVLCDRSRSLSWWRGCDFASRNLVNASL